MAFPGCHLRPLFGVNYAPYPSDFLNWGQGGLYPPTGSDFFHQGFHDLWARSGRGDLSTMHNWGANAIRTFNHKDYYNHASFLSAAADQGLGVLVPISNEALLFAAGADFAPAAAWITKIVQEARDSPAAIAWGLTNELNTDPAIYTGGSGSSGAFADYALPRVVQAARLIDQLDRAADGCCKPIVITSIFDAGFATAKAVKAAFTAAGEGELYNRRVVNGLNMYFNEDPSLHATIIHNVLTDYFADPDLGQMPLITTEYGRSSAAPFSPASQADTIATQGAEFKAAATGSAFPRFLGAFVFVFSDANLEGTHKTFGLLEYDGSCTTAGVGEAAYRVDGLAAKPASEAFKHALST